MDLFGSVLELVEQFVFSHPCSDYNMNFYYFRIQQFFEDVRFKNVSYSTQIDLINSLLPSNWSTISIVNQFTPEMKQLFAKLLVKFCVHQNIVLDIALEVEEMVSKQPPEILDNLESFYKENLAQFNYLFEWLKLRTPQHNSSISNRFLCFILYKQNTIISTTEGSSTAVNQLCNLKEQFPTFAYIYNNMSLDENIQQSIENLSEAIRLCPIDALFYVNRSRYYTMVFDRENAEKDMNTAIEMIEKHPTDYSYKLNEIYHFRALQNIQFDLLDQVILDLQKSISLDPKFDASLYSMLAEILLDSDRIEEANATIEAGFKIKPYDIELQFVKLRCDYTRFIQNVEVAKGFIKETVNMARNADREQMAKMKKYAFLSNQNVSKREQKTQLERMVVMMNKVVMRRNYYTQYMLDYILQEKDSKEGLYSEQVFGKMHYERAESFMREKKWVAALHDLDQAIACDPQNSKFFQQRAVVHGTMLQSRKAIEDQELAIKLAKPSKKRGLDLLHLTRFNVFKFYQIESTMPKKSRLYSQYTVFGYIFSKGYLDEPYLLRHYEKNSFQVIVTRQITSSRTYEDADYDSVLEMISGTD